MYADTLAFYFIKCNLIELHFDLIFPLFKHISISNHRLYEIAPLNLPAGNLLKFLHKIHDLRLQILWKGYFNAPTPSPFSDRVPRRKIELSQPSETGRYSCARRILLTSLKFPWLYITTLLLRGRWLEIFSLV